ncbi:hypothetical protein Agabi119p4_7137 [Agaricus bisporus var. burnettii]|uniref:Uncharacterized protein n=1 Tax=Agaricus bisporus var. burnettii TaxID=192524 RepID=A0A8H7C8E6_AGABI|nr:hypothetical protein Agabi119p4_7137 [Agaricus bisporus var. burnettii]
MDIFVAPTFVKPSGLLYHADNRMELSAFPVQFVAAAMTDLYTSKISQLPHIPDDMSVAQFMLYCQHEVRPPIDDDLPCLVESRTGKTLNLAQLRRYTFGLANALRSDYNIGKDDRVMILSPNTIDYPLVAWSIHRLGGIITCSNPQFTADELCHQLRTANVTFMIVHSTVLDVSLHAARVCGLPDDRIILLDQPGYAVGNLSTSKYTPMPPRGMVPDLIAKGSNIPCCFTEQTFQRGEGKHRVALLAWSSGTTGTPKAVAISHYGVIANVVQMAAQSSNSRASHYGPGDSVIGVLPFFHVAGFVISIHFMLFRSLKLIVMPKYDLLDMLDIVARHKVSHLLLVPPQAVALSKYPHLDNYDLKSLKHIATGAAPLSPDVQKDLHTIFPTLRIGQIYGTTELTAVAAMLSADQQQGPLGSGGRLLPGTEARVVRPDGTPSDPDELGELLLKSPAAALGYWGNASATQETFIDGWVRTGDQVIVTPDQEVYVLDRIKEFIKVRGFQVAPAELEGSLLGHPDIIDCCVVGVEDERSGEVPLAYVVLSADAKKRSLEGPQMASDISESIQHFIAEKKARYKHLTGGVQFIDTLPRNGSGKLLRRILRQRAREDKKHVPDPCQSKL